jgi:hypothetical protein
VEHPSEETLKRFVTGKASREENREVVAHLLKGCAPCASKVKTLMEPDPVAGPSYDSSLERFDKGLLEALEATGGATPSAPVSPQPRPPCAPPRDRPGNSD